MLRSFGVTSIGRNTCRVLRNRFSSTTDNGLIYCRVDGLSRFASRKDIVNCCGSIVPRRLDGIIDNKFFPTGSYALQLHSMGEFNELQANANAVHPLTFQMITKAEYDLLSTTSKAEITMRSIRVELTEGSNCSKEDLTFFFRDFQVLRVRSIQRKPIQEDIPYSTLFVVDFDSAEEAERAVQEKINHSIYLGKAKLIWYNC